MGSGYEVVGDGSVAESVGYCNSPNFTTRCARGTEHTERPPTRWFVEFMGFIEFFELKRTKRTSFLSALCAMLFALCAK